MDVGCLVIFDLRNDVIYDNKIWSLYIVLYISVV